MAARTDGRLISPCRHHYRLDATDDALGLVTASMASLASCFLVGYMLLLLGIDHDQYSLHVIYFLEHTGAMWIGVGSMHTVGGYLATFRSSAVS